MKQQKISNFLKGLTILLGLMGVVFFGALTGIAFYLKGIDPYNMRWTFVFFSWYTAALCYGVLFQFWNVCNQIRKDNSFSMENAKAFHIMGLLGVASGVGYILRAIYLGIACSVSFVVICYSVFLVLLSGIFFGLCEALSKLIQNAYEVKLENDLTI